jgi:hypothetical protein
MDNQPLTLTLEPLFAFRGRQVQVWQEATTGSAEGTRSEDGERRGLALATIILDRSIVVGDGETYAIQAQGRAWSGGRSLWRGAAPAAGDSPLATYRRERTGWLGSRQVVRVNGAPEPAYLLRQRSSWGAPSNVDVIALPPEGQDPRSAGPVLLRVERVGRWKRSLRAQLLDPAALPLAIALFVLNLLAMQERSAASAQAASAGAVSVTG